MKSEPIKVGDLVVVVKPTKCCGATKRLGHIFKADNIVSGPNHCGACGTQFEVTTVVWQTGQDWSMPISCLKRIPPLSELDDVKKDEEIHA